MDVFIRGTYRKDYIQRNRSHKQKKPNRNDENTNDYNKSFIHPSTSVPNKVRSRILYMEANRNKDANLFRLLENSN